jgi:glycosyltransferase involved in cell wall biosynthesis
MRLLLVHNYYRFGGGEDTVFAAEQALLRQHGHEVSEYVEDNRRIAEMPRLAAAGQCIWSWTSQYNLQRVLGDEPWDVVHFHNTFPLISPSAYYVCRQLRIPVVQTVHNYRLLCPAATLFRNGRPCEDCLGKTIYWPGALHSCYRGSYAQSAVAAAMVALHRLLRTWQEQVDVYIAPTEFVRNKLIEGGFPKDRIAVKPHFVHPDPGIAKHQEDYALFVGRLVPEKGLSTLLAAWEKVGDIRLKIAGEGPLLEEIMTRIRQRRLRHVELLGQLPRPDVHEVLRKARVLIFPSAWYEPFGMILAEAFACGVPAIASRLGAMAEIVHDGQTGLHFAPGDPNDLAAKVLWAFTHPERLEQMAHRARYTFESKYRAEENYEMLRSIYQIAIERAHKWT